MKRLYALSHSTYLQIHRTAQRVASATTSVVLQHYRNKQDLSDHNIVQRKVIMRSTLTLGAIKYIYAHPQM